MVFLKLSQCFNPYCLDLNPYGKALCQRCGSKLLLAERYRAVRYINAGGFACTFEAVDEHRLQTPCVIKQFRPLQKDRAILEKSLQLFEQEAVILRDLGKHPQIPELLAFFEQEGQLYLVQEFIEGVDLFQEFKQTGAFSEEKIERILRELLPILAFVHQHQVVHRDIKPSNIIRRQDGSLVLIDFGSSQIADETAPARRVAIAGTPGYAPPGQMQGKVYAASDLYGLGATCIRLLAGCFPENDSCDILFDPKTQKWLWRQQGLAIAARLERILNKLLQVDVTKRYQSADEVLQDLNSTAQTSKAIAAVANPNKDFSSDSLDPTEEIAKRYRKLRDLLAAGKYESADRETWNLMLSLARREKEGCLTIKAIAQFPLEDLSAIDRLWQEYSDGKFGLSVQKQIYQSLGGSKAFNYQIWQNFGERVGWYVGGEWLNYAELDFSDRAVAGHLPACFVDALNRSGIARGVCGWWRLGFVATLQKLDESQGLFSIDRAPPLTMQASNLNNLLLNSRPD